MVGKKVLHFKIFMEMRKKEDDFGIFMEIDRKNYFKIFMGLNQKMIKISKCLWNWAEKGRIFWNIYQIPKQIFKKIITFKKAPDKKSAGISLSF